MGYELSDYEWTAIKPMLPNKPRGVQCVNDRRVLSTESFWYCAQVGLGVICPKTMDLLRPATIALSVGAGQAFGTGSWKHWQALTIRRCR